MKTPPKKTKLTLSPILKESLRPTLPELKETIAAECLDILRREYEIERGKRQSFETRAGIIMAALATLYLFVLERMPLFGGEELSSAIKIIFCSLAYISFFASLLYAVDTIAIRTYQNFAVEEVKEWLIGKRPLTGTIYLIQEYRKIIEQHRKQNASAAHSLMCSMICLCIFLVVVVIYMNI